MTGVGQWGRFRVSHTGRVGQWGLTPLSHTGWLTGGVAELARVALASAAGGRVVVLIDGRSGAGKTTLAADLAAGLNALGQRDVQVVSLDDVYPGWNGLAVASHAVSDTILAPESPGYHRYDWATGTRAEWVELDPTKPLIVEGAGALTPDSARLATLRVWRDVREVVRRRAVQERDPDAAAWWDAWAAQERAHIEDHHPPALADIVLSGWETVEIPCSDCGGPDRAGQRPGVRAG